MPEFTREIVIDRPPATVFAVLDDLDQAKAWMPAIRKIEILTPGQKMGVGFKWRETRRIFGIVPIRVNLTITGHEPSKHWRLLFNDGKVAATAAFDLDERNGSTEITLTEEAEDLQGRPERAEKMLRMMEKHDGDLLERLKAHVESTVPGAAAHPGRKAASKVASKPGVPAKSSARKKGR